MRIRLIRQSLWLLIVAACTSEPDPPAVVPLEFPSPVPTLTPFPPAQNVPSPTLTPFPSTQNAPSPTSTTPAPGPAKLLFTSYAGGLVESEIPVIVYLPKGFNTGQTQYPTIYLLHGLGFDEGMWVDLGVRAVIEQQPPLVLIMPYMPQPLMSQTDGGPNSYEAEFMESLLPQLEERFRVDPNRRAIAGISRGAVWAIEIGFRHPSDFKAIAALSPSLHQSRPRPAYDPYLIAAEDQPLPAVIHLTTGDRERQTIEALERLAEVLEAAGASYELVISEGNHNEMLWRTQIEAALTALVEGILKD